MNMPVPFENHEVIQAAKPLATIKSPRHTNAEDAEVIDVSSLQEDGAPKNDIGAEPRDKNKFGITGNMFLQLGSLAPVMEKIAIIITTDDSLHLSHDSKVRLIEELRIEADRIAALGGDGKTISETERLKLLEHVIGKTPGTDILSQESKQQIAEQFALQHEQAKLLDQQRQKPGLGAILAGALGTLGSKQPNLRDFQKAEIGRLVDQMNTLSSEFVANSGTPQWLRKNGKNSCQKINECVEGLDRYMKVAGRHINTREFRQSIDENIKNIQAAAKKTRGTLTEDQDKELLENIKKLADNLLANFNKLMQKVGKAIGIYPKTPTPA